MEVKQWVACFEEWMYANMIAFSYNQDQMCERLGIEIRTILPMKLINDSRIVYLKTIEGAIIPNFAEMTNALANF